MDRLNLITEGATLQPHLVTYPPTHPAGSPRSLIGGRGGQPLQVYGSEHNVYRSYQRYSITEHQTNHQRSSSVGGRKVE
jgi:hypothetical protein